MATNKNITMKQYNGSDYDTLYPKTTPEQVGAVSYEAQTLTDGQKTQARGNINAAPGGFGLGGTAKMLTEADNVDNIKASGWYTWDWDPSKQPAGLPEEAKYHTGNMRVDGTTGGFYTTQVIYLAKNGSSVNVGDECVIQRLRTTAPWEWVNPPMELGVEYRTTERYLGKPVYVKLINCGNLPDGTTKEVAHGITNLAFIVGAQAIASNSSSGFGFNGHAYLPVIYNGLLTDRWTNYLAGVNTNNIRIFCGGGLAGCPVYVTFKYTKTTD